MDNSSEPEKISLWGVLHDGELREIKTDAANQTADLHIVVRHLSEFFGWPEHVGIRFHFDGVNELRVNQWVPDPAKGSEDIRTRRWTRREWQTLEQVVPPHALMILEATLYHADDRAGRIELAGYELDEDGNSTDLWLEATIQGSRVGFASPEGPLDLDRLLQMGDAYWDNFGKKRKR